MNTARIAIVGGGLSGLYAAWLLEQKGLGDYVLLEARDVPGGRIVSAPVILPPGASDLAVADNINRFDLGPSWFWPEFQPELDRLVHDLGLERFEQFETGDMMVERWPAESAMRVRGFASVPSPKRIAGGMAALTDALLRGVDAMRVLTGRTVRRLRSVGMQVEVDSQDATGRIETWRVEHVLLAIPPRLVEQRIEFEPALPRAQAKQWRATPTWMAPHAKYVAVYDTPFWREQGLSGAARSARGPLGEIHDASVPGGSCALFGFFGVSARDRRRTPENVLRSHCRAQLARLFGPQAARPTVDFIKDWAAEPYTATVADQDHSDHDATPPPATIPSAPWAGCVTGIASEWALRFPGYVAGAIEAAGLGVEALAERANEEMP